MDAIEINRHSLIVKKANELKLVLCNGYGASVINEIIQNSQNIIDKYNVENYTIADPSNVEVGQFRSTVKKFITNRFGTNKLIYILIDNTEFSEYIQNMYILLNRKFSYSYKGQNKLRLILLDTIRNAVIEEFINYNKKYINKILKTNENTRRTKTGNQRKNYPRC